MKTAADREYEFRNDLHDLLNKHKATLDITTVGEGFRSRPALVVSMYSDWDIAGEQIAEYSEFEL